MSHSSYKRLKTCFLACLLGLIAWSSQAVAGVTITPNTLIIEGRERYADVMLINAGNAPNTYEMSWRFFRMDEGTGKYVNIDTPTTDFNIAQNVVFTPKRITLVPGKAQKVRLALRLKGDAPPPGDYRGHFELKEATPLAELPSDSSAPSVGVRMKIGFTIPVVYRVGESNATATIGNVSTQINRNSGKIEAVIPIIKSQSPYGTLGALTVYYKPANGPETKVGSVSNANIFPEITTRTFTVPLKTDDLKGGALRIVYSDRQEEKNLIYAEKSIPIGQ